jgi:hypothetical protein
MPFSVRLDPETEALIERLARNSRQARAWVVREAVARYAGEGRETETLYDRMKPHIGVFRSGSARPLSEDTGTRFTEIVRAKARARRGARANTGRAR